MSALVSATPPSDKPLISGATPITKVAEFQLASDASCCHVKVFIACVMRRNSRCYDVAWVPINVRFCDVAQVQPWPTGRTILRSLFYISWQTQRLQVTNNCLKFTFHFLFFIFKFLRTKLLPAKISSPLYDYLFPYFFSYLNLKIRKQSYQAEFIWENKISK